MKKIILLLILFFITINVKAETIYGQYYKVNSLNNEPLDEVKIERYKIFNTFETIYKDLGYLEENNIYIKDENDYIEKEVILTEPKDNTIFVEVITPVEEIDKIILKDKTKNIKIYEIEVYYQDKKIEYTVDDIGYYPVIGENIITSIYDNDTNTYYKDRRPNLPLELNLMNKYNLEDLKIIIYSDNDILPKFNLDLGHLININLYNKKHIITFKNSEIQDAIYSYKDIIKLYKYYEEQKLKKDIYVKEGKNLLLDDFKIIEEFYKREKIVLKDNLTITNTKDDINSLIEYSSNKVITKCDINYTKNGNYQCKFILNDINIEKNILVNIDENEKVINITSKNIKLNKGNNKVKTIKKNKKTTRKLQTKEIITKPTELKEKNKIVLKEKEIKKQNYNKNIIKVMILIIFIIIEIIIIYKKKKR